MCKLKIKKLKRTVFMRTRQEVKARFHVLSNKLVEEQGILCYPSEMFAEIPFSKGYYVSNYGRVLNTKKEKYKLLKPFKKESDKEDTHVKVDIALPKKPYIHHLVAMIFLRNEYGDFNFGRKINEMQVHHIDEIKTNNRADNLCFVYKKHHDMFKPSLINKTYNINGEYKTIMQLKLENDYSWHTLYYIFNSQKKNKGRINYGIMTGTQGDVILECVFVDGKLVNKNETYKDHYYLSEDRTLNEIRYDRTKNLDELLTEMYMKVQFAKAIKESISI